jgi:choline transport protein
MNLLHTSLITGCITFLYLSYSIPVICLLIRGRSNIQHGPFWLGRVGLVSNIVLLGWTLFSLVFFSFPFVMPATPGKSSILWKSAYTHSYLTGNMNYVSVVLVGYTLYLSAYWYLRGHRTFHIPEISEKRVANHESDIKAGEYP